jgi:hypothetical protein
MAIRCSTALKLWLPDRRGNDSPDQKLCVFNRVNDRSDALKRQ